MIASPSIPARGLGIAAIALLAMAPLRGADASEIMGASPQAASAPSPGFDALQSGSHHRPPRQAQTRGCNGQCGNHQCGHCKHGKHGDCDACGGRGCPANCPVRPGKFGYYDTQWRNWPGQGVVQAAFTEPAAPVEPPKLEVPTANEESPAPTADSIAPEPGDTDMGAEPAPQAEVLPPALEKMPAAEEPSQPETEDAKPDVKPDAKPDVKQEPRPDLPAEENLFDEATLRRRQQERLTTLQQAAYHRERVRQEALRQQATVNAPRPIAQPVVQPAVRRTAGGLRKVSHEEPVVQPDRDNPLRKTAVE